MNQEKSKELINKSLQHEDSFSSTSHAIDVLAKEIKEPPQKIYEIPSSYDKDRIKIMMVNPSKYYVYWEVSNETLNRYNIDLNKEKLYFKIFDNSENLLFEFDSSFALSDYYVKKEFENMDIKVRLEIEKEGSFVPILSSNEIHTFSTKINLPDVNSEVWIKRSKGWTEVIKDTVHHFTLGMSSSKYVEEIERLKEFEQSEAFNESSSSLIKENK